MPRTDREDSRKRLAKELLKCGISQQDADRLVAMFSDEHFTSNDVTNIKKLLWEVRLVFEAQRQKLEKDLQSEKALRQGFLDHIKEFVGESIKRLKEFADLAEAADKCEIGLSPKGIAKYRAVVAERRGPS
jgi:hypothetical protein